MMYVKINLLKTKTQAITSASEVAIMILRIDDIIAAGKTKSKSEENVCIYFDDCQDDRKKYERIGPCKITQLLSLRCLTLGLVPQEDRGDS